MKRADISLFRGKPKPEPADFPPEMTETPAHTLRQEEVDCIQPTTPSLAKIRHSLPFRYKNRARASGQVGVLEIRAAPDHTGHALRVKLAKGTGFRL